MVMPMSSVVIRGNAAVTHGHTIVIHIRAVVTHGNAMDDHGHPWLCHVNAVVIHGNTMASPRSGIAMVIRSNVTGVHGYSTAIHDHAMPWTSMLTPWQCHGYSWQHVEIVVVIRGPSWQC